jgi:hypothetical protein
LEWEVSIDPGSFNSTQIHGTHVPAEEPSTASISGLTHCNKIGEIKSEKLLRGLLNPHIDFAAERHEVDRLGQKRLCAAF